MIKVLRFPYSGNLNPANVGISTSGVSSGDSVITVSVDPALPLPYFIMVEDLLSKDSEIVKVVSVDTQSGIELSVEAPFKNNHNSGIKIFSVQDPTFEIRSSNQVAYDEIFGTTVVDTSIPYIQVELTNNLDYELAYIYFHESDSYGDGLMISDAPTTLLTVDDSIKYGVITSEMQSYYSFDQLTDLIINVSSLITSEFGYEISRQVSYDNDSYVITGTLANTKESVVMNAVRPVVEIQSDLVITTDSGKTVTIPKEDLRIRRGCIVFNSGCIGPNTIVDDGVFEGVGNSICYARIQYLGGLRTLPSQVISAMSQYLKVLHSTNTQDDPTLSGLKKQKHYNREVHYQSMSQISDPVKSSTSAKSAKSLISTIKDKYLGF